MFAKWIESDGRFIFQDFDNGGVEISRDEHAELVAGHADGKTIIRDADGRPMLGGNPEPTADELWAAYQQKALAALDKTDSIALRCWKAVTYHKINYDYK